MWKAVVALRDDVVMTEREMIADRIIKAARAQHESDCHGCDVCDGIRAWDALPTEPTLSEAIRMVQAAAFVREHASMISAGLDPLAAARRAWGAAREAGDAWTYAVEKFSHHDA